MGTGSPKQEDKKMSKLEKLALAQRVFRLLEKEGAGVEDVYDVLLIIGHLIFSGQNLNLTISRIKDF